jgi:hypothetical protein
MKLSVVLVTALLASLSGTAQADTIHVGSKHVAGQPTIMRGAPLRCHASRPLIINVREALKHPERTIQKCEAQFKRVDRGNSYTNINIVVIAGRHKGHYIDHH